MSSIRNIDPTAYYIVLGVAIITGISIVADVAGLIGNQKPDCGSYDSFWKSVDAQNIVYEHPNGSVAYSYDDRPEQINMTVRNAYYYRCKI